MAWTGSMDQWSGLKDRGGRTGTENQQRAVMAEMQLHIGRRNRISYEALAGVTGVPGRTIRDIISEADGIDCVFGVNESDVWIAESYDETVRHTTKLRATARSYTERADRREAFAANLPRVQQVMFGGGA